MTSHVAVPVTSAKGLKKGMPATKDEGQDRCKSESGVLSSVTSRAAERNPWYPGSRGQPLPITPFHQTKPPLSTSARRQHTLVEKPRDTVDTARLRQGMYRSLASIADSYGNAVICFLCAAIRLQETGSFCSAPVGFSGRVVVCYSAATACDSMKERKTGQKVVSAVAIHLHKVHVPLRGACLDTGAGLCLLLLAVSHCALFACELHSHHPRLRLPCDRATL